LFPEQQQRRNKKVPDGSVEKITRREQFMLYAPLFIWIGVIFFLSSGQGASTRTSIIIRPILEFLFPHASFETISFYHGIIRKLAHLTEYAVLGLLASRAFFRSRSTLLRKHFSWMAVLLVVLVASSDEFNQSFNPDRTSSPVDVLIDLTGGAIAVLFFYLWTKRRDRKPSSSPSRP
jgi:VanZ family protein